MYTDTEKKGQLTVGGRDPRITSVGYFLRRFKIDELPQFLNVLKGEMSFVGPRPEVRKYVSLYTLKQMEVLSVLPGITDLASIEFRNENELLAKADDPEKFYIQVVMPRKIELNYRFIEHRNLKNYFTILFTTVATAVKGK
jgi:lipopolysaccharide/colanic/teichoic acid biosynthesis glycosyltransferase